MGSSKSPEGIPEKILKRFQEKNVEGIPGWILTGFKEKSWKDCSKNPEGIAVRILKGFQLESRVKVGGDISLKFLTKLFIEFFWNFFKKFSDISPKTSQKILRKNSWDFSFKTSEICNEIYFNFSYVYLGLFFLDLFLNYSKFSFDFPLNLSEYQFIILWNIFLWFSLKRLKKSLQDYFEIFPQVHPLFPLEFALKLFWIFSEITLNFFWHTHRTSPETSMEFLLELFLKFLKNEFQNWFWSILILTKLFASEIFFWDFPKILLKYHWTIRWPTLKFLVYCLRNSLWTLLDSSLQILIKFVVFFFF